jgi:hypothetical protein
MTSTGIAKVEKSNLEIGLILSRAIQRVNVAMFVQKPVIA